MGMVIIKVDNKIAPVSPIVTPRDQTPPIRRYQFEKVSLMKEGFKSSKAARKDLLKSGVPFSNSLAMTNGRAYTYQSNTVSKISKATSIEINVPSLTLPYV